MQVFPLQCKARIQVSLKWTLPFGADFLAAVLDWPLGTAKEIVPFCWRLVKQAAAGLPESYPSGGTSTGTSTGLCHGQCLSDQQRSSYHVLWFLTPHPKVLASLSWPDIIFVFPASLAILGIYRSFNSLPSSLFILFSYFSQYFHPKLHAFSSPFNLHTWNKQPLCELCIYPCTTKEKRGIE